MDDNQYYAYVLKDPETGDCFYVGKSSTRSRPGSQRLKDHVGDAKRSGGSNPIKNKKIQSILSKGLKPIFEIIEFYEKEDEALKKERELYDLIGKENLTNIAPCGTKYVDLPRTETWRGKIGKSNSEAWKKKWSDPKFKKMWSKKLRGRKLSAETRLRMKDAAKAGWETRRRNNALLLSVQ